MIWVKSAFAGLVAAIITLVGTIVAMTSWHMNAGVGSGGGIGVVSVGPSALLLFPAALAFAAGFIGCFGASGACQDKPRRTLCPIAEDSDTPTRPPRRSFRSRWLLKSDVEVRHTRPQPDFRTAIALSVRKLRCSKQ